MTDETHNPGRTMPDDTSRLSGDIALVVSRDGSVKSVLRSESSSALGQSAGELLETQGKLCLDDLWPAGLRQHIVNNVRRVLRERSFRREEKREPATGFAAELTYVANGPDSVILLVRDLVERQDELHRMHRLAYIDEATSLPNRELFLNELKDITEFQRLREGRIAVVVVNVSQADESRASYGAAQQDEVLAEIAKRLNTELRGANSEDKSDVERRTVIARTDFRDFGIVLPSIESGVDAEAVARRVLDAACRPVEIRNRTVKLTGFAGIALFPQDGNDPAVLLENAMAAMEDASCSNDTDIKFHTGTVRLRTLQRQDLELELRAALDTQEFAVNYQPIVDANSGAIRSVEALLRWPESVLGSRSTRKIVSIAERTSLISAIGRWVLQRSCEQVMAWKDQGYARMRLSVNVSSQEFARPDLVETISGTLVRVGMQPTDLALEINEHILFRDAMKNYATCRALRKIGVSIVVDDYGIGSCSLAHLAHSPVDCIKIDHALVANLETNGRDNAACDAAIALAHALGLDVVAEGVETEEQARLLIDLGCDYLQGYHYYPPMSEAELAGYLEAGDGTQRNRALRGA